MRLIASPRKGVQPKGAAVTMAMEDLIRRAVVKIREKYYEPLDLEELARTAMLSKFYFLRKFHDCTGMTPVRFLAAVRIHEAKRLLYATSHNVADISIRVGYSSPGTFTRRFTECVGLSPTLFRSVARGDGGVQSVSFGPRMPAVAGHGRVSGTVTAVSAVSSPIFVGLFRTQLPRGLAVAWTAVTRAGHWCITRAPSGCWHVIAAAGADLAADATQPASHGVLVAEVGDVRIRPGADTFVDLTIRPLDWSHPPLLVALPGIDRYAVRPT